MSHRGAADAFDGGVCGLSGIDVIKQTEDSPMPCCEHALHIYVH